MKVKVFIIILASLFAPLGIQAAGLYILPSEGTYFIDEAIVLELRLDTDHKKINAVEIYLKFSPEEAEILDFISGGSALDVFFDEPKISGPEGRASFAGGSTSGFISDEALLGKLLIKPKKIGQLTINYSILSRALIADGRGTPVELDLLSGTYKIDRRAQILRITSSSHPDQNKWNPSPNLTLYWPLRKEAKYSYILSRDPQAMPDDAPEELVGEIEFFGLEDGIYYFHLKEMPLKGAWDKPTSYRVMIDSLPPEPFEISLGKDKGVFGGSYFISFNTGDTASGIDYYRVCEGILPCEEGKSPYVLEKQFLGAEIIVKAYDKAGHFREAKIKPKRIIPIFYLALALFGVLAILSFAFLFKKICRRPNK